MIRALKRLWSRSGVQIIRTRFDFAKREKKVTKITVETYKEPL